MAILGITPDFKVGWGVIDDGKLIDWGLVEQNSETPVPNRLLKTYNSLDFICDKYPIEVMVIKSPRSFPGRGQWRKINTHEFIIGQIATNKVIAIAECIAGKWNLGTKVYFVDKFEFDDFDKSREFVKRGFNINVHRETAEAIFLALKKEKVLIRDRILKKESCGI